MAPTHHQLHTRKLDVASQLVFTNIRVLGAWHARLYGTLWRTHLLDTDVVARRPTVCWNSILRHARVGETSRPAYCLPNAPLDYLQLHDISTGSGCARLVPEKPPLGEHTDAGAGSW